MNADPALPVSKGNDAGSIQKVNSGSFPNENQGKFGYIIWSLHKTIPLFPKDTYNSTKQRIFAAAFRLHLHFTGNFSHPSNFTG